MEKKLVYRYLAVYLIFVLLLVGLIFLKYVSLTGFAVFSQSSQTDFNEGTYLNTNYNGSAVVLSGNNLTGNYTSKIFDAGNIANWNSLTKQDNKPDINFLYAVDNTADVWKSGNLGVAWTKVNDDYNGALGNAVTTSFFGDNKNYYVFHNQDVFKSTDFGVSFSIINDDYNGAEGQNLDVAVIDKNFNFFIIEADQDVWNSNNSGLNFVKVASNFNGGNGAVTGFVVNSSNTFIAGDSASDVWASYDSGANWILMKDDYNGAAANNVDGMSTDSNNNIYILDIQDLWKSTDSGITWTKINDDFNGAGDSESGISIAINSDNNIYIVDGGEDVFKSTDSGINFVQVTTNFNGAGGNIPTITSVLRETNLTYLVRNCSLQDCSDGIWQEKDLSNLDLQSRYFQYKSIFSSPDSSTTPTLTSVSIDYGLVDAEAPNITINSPLNQTYNAATILVNITATDPNLDSIWFYNGSENITYVSASQHIFAKGSNTIIAYANDSLGNENSSSVYFYINSAPTITLINPGEGNTYGYNESLSLNFSASDTDNNINSCWYHINSGDNTTIFNCENTTLNVAGDGSYYLKIYVNDTQGEQANNSVSFSVQIGAPTIILNSPTNNAYLNYQDIEFNYTPSDIDLASCELWGDFVGSFTRNQIQNSPVNNQINQFNLSLNDGTYLWNIKCNDSIGNSAFEGNKTFTIDTIIPEITLIQPTGGKDSRTVAASWQITDENLGTCKYNVYRGTGIEISNTSVTCYRNTTNFTVTLDADFVFNFYAQDLAGNLISSSLDFDVVTSSSGGGTTTTETTGGGGGTPSTTIARLQLSGIGDVVTTPGESKTLSITADNTGTIFLNKCKLEGNLISTSDVKGLAIGQQETFVFILNVPEDFVDKETIELSLRCEEAEKSVSFSVFSSKNILEIELLSTEQKSKKFNFAYLVKDKTKNNKEINVRFYLRNADDEKVVEGSDSFNLKAGEELIRQGSLDLPDAGQYILKIDLDSDGSIVSLEEPVLIGTSTGLFGRAILVAGGGKILSIAILFALVAFVIIYVVRRIIKKPLKEDRTGFVKIKLNKEEQ